MIDADEPTVTVGLLTGGDDLPYALGLTRSLAALGVFVEFIGSDKVNAPELHTSRFIRFLNLRGDQREDAPVLVKARRLLKYYARLIVYAARAEPPIFHILWNNKFEYFDRTILMLYYRVCGRKVVFTAHNVNAARRDGHDSWLNRITLRIQYRLANHIFVHTEKMKEELKNDFQVPAEKITVIPFGVYETSPRTELTPPEAKRRLGLSEGEPAMLFFGQIASYKGLEHLVDALPMITAKVPGARLIIAGRVKRGHEAYWESVKKRLKQQGAWEATIRRIDHIPEAELEVYFKAADVLILPYTSIFQSGVLFLSFGFGLPVIATDVGAFRDDVIDGETGFICAPGDPHSLALAVERYFKSPLYRDIDLTRRNVERRIREGHSWDTVARITERVYSSLLKDGRRDRELPKVL